MFFTISWSSLKLMSIESMMPSNRLIFCYPFSSCPQSFPASGSFLISRLFPSGGQSIGASDSTLSPSNEYSGLISFRIDQLDLPAVLGSPDSQEAFPAPQFKSINSSAFSLLYGSTFTSGHDYWKTMALTICTFVGKVILKGLNPTN